MLFVKVGHFVLDMLLFNNPEKKVVDSEDLLACSTTLSQTKLVCKLAPARVAEALLHSTSPSTSMYKVVNIVQRLLRHRTRPSSEGTNARKKIKIWTKNAYFFYTRPPKKNLIFNRSDIRNRRFFAPAFMLVLCDRT